MLFVLLMIETIIFDLDGPILDTKKRHYYCYRNILNQYGYEPLDIEKYWQLKRKGIHRREILALTKAENIDSEFLQNWLNLIETPSLLNLDTLQIGVKEKLEDLHNQGLQLILVTLRSNPTYLSQQLDQLKLSQFFNHILVCEHQLGGIGKAEKIKQISPSINPNNSLWIGDTEIDIQGARHFGCKIWAVSCGIRTKSYLASFKPDFLSSDFANMDSILFNRGKYDSVQ